MSVARTAFNCRWYQAPLHQHLTQTPSARAIEIAHRRWGKDEVALDAEFRCATATPDQVPNARIGNYWHCLPEYAQARKAMWNAVNANTGKRRIDEAFPLSERESTNESEMLIKFKSGSTWQLIGSDRYDATVGSGPVWITYSEWALANPSAWGYHRPMLEENGGTALFISTPRGNNHCKAMFDMASASARWFAEVSNVHDTKALTEAQLDEALLEYQALYGLDFGRAMFEQEYLCSFSGAMVGAYFGAEMNRAEREGRIREVEIAEGQPVHTAWDLGKAVNNPIWCFQVIKGQPRIVDFYQPETEDLADWVHWLSERGYHGNDYVPHDILVTEWGSKRTRFEILQGMGRKPKRLPRVSVADGLQAARTTINAAVFADTERVQAGIEGLKNYRREWDDERKTFRDTPIKDWAEHIGSAFRYLGLAWKEVVPPKPKEKKPKDLQYQVDKHGRIQGNMSVKQAVDAMVKRRRQRGY